MVSITQLAHDIIRTVLSPGEMAIDCTAGNGHDTLFLAQHVGPQGRIWAFDIQPAALASTRQKIEPDHARQVELILANHAELEQRIPADADGLIAAVMFNLGYLPYQDHALTTLRETTLLAAAAALKLLRPGGALTLVTYRGHPGGAEEAEAVENWIAALPRPEFQSFRYPDETPRRGPQLLAVKKKMT